MPRCRLLVHPHAGFTLIETLVAVTIVIILVGVAAPSLRAGILNARMSAQAMDLMADIALARSEAVKRNERVLLCVSSNSVSAASPTCTGGTWNQGYIVFVDTSKGGNHNVGEPLLKAVPAFASGNTVAATTTTIPYAPTGSPVPGTAQITLTLCDTRTGSAGANAGRSIIINTTGRPVLSRFSC